MSASYIATLLSYCGVYLEQYNQCVVRGYEHMKNSNIAICGTVRDCANSLSNNIFVIEQLRSKFQNSVVIIIENDSIDNTKQVLDQWSKTSRNVVIECQDFGIQTIKVVGGKVDRSFSRHRIEQMCKHRQRYMNRLALEKNLDYVMVVDLDLESINIDGIANSFGQALDWDAITANGVSAKRRLKDSYQGHVYFDTYALRHIGDSKPRTRSAIMDDQILMQGMEKGAPLLAVASAFGGLAIYRYPALMSANYCVLDNADPEVEVLCEHIGLHKQMAENGHRNIYINPSMLVLYESYRTRAKAVLRRNLERIRQ